MDGSTGRGTAMAVTIIAVVTMTIHVRLAMGQGLAVGDCKDTTTFSCQNGGTCEMIVQGEKYKCHCGVPYYGDMCQLTGDKCGDIYCLNGGVCMDNLCDCPAEWNVDATCSVPSPTGPVGEVAQTITVGSDGPKWYTVLFGILGGLIGLGLVVAAGVLLYRKHELESSLSFQEMKPGEVQMQPGPGLAPLENESLMPRGQPLSPDRRGGVHASPAHV